MAEEWTSWSVAEWTSGGGMACWKVQSQRPDGTTHIHVFPQSTLEWRMAEYGLETVDEALDMVLHEPFATDPADPLLARDDAALRVGMVTRLPGTVEDYDTIRLHNADTIADAREAQDIRVADVKTGRVRIVPPEGEPDPLDIIRQRHRCTDDGIREKAALVDAARRAYRGEALPPADDIILDTAAHERPLETGRA
ncbi:hypothetical protein [Streptomyces sp. NPDC056723]|uniref:hypothetical protein n=1 Tax=Streptomyces sp. NPDC056723 TaxID=3345925 RepID=UPI0036C98C83